MSKSEFFSPLTGEDISFVGQAVNDFYKRNDSVELYDFGPSLTRQDMADECDINVIMAKYAVTGVLPVKEGVPQYVDFDTVPDNLLDAMASLHAAEEQFMRLPANVRREFDNDPVQFVAFATDPANLDQLRDWDLAPKKPQEPPVVAPEPVSVQAPIVQAEPPKPA
jgi:hypothetical protein